MGMIPEYEKGMATKILTMCVIAAMLISGMILLAQDTTGLETAGNKEYYTVVFTDDMGPRALQRSPNVEIIKMDSMGAVVRLTGTLRKELSNTFSVNEMNERTRVRFMEAGVEFDSRQGYEAPTDWKSAGGNQYIVQFVAPMTGEWLETVKGNSDAFFDTVGTNLAILKLSPGQKAQIEKLQFVEWVGTYEPMFKAHTDARFMTGEFNVRVMPFGVSTWQLAQELSGMGFQLIDIDHGCNLVDIAVSEHSLPLVAKLDSVGLIEYFPENVQQGSISGEIVGATVVWDTARSNLPVQITGLGQVYHHQDLKMSAHPDFTQGPQGDRLIYVQSYGDGTNHATGCVGIAAGNGYSMETWLGLSTSNRNYNEIAASNPIGMLDRAGITGRAPETGIVAYDGLVTSDLATSYSTWNSRLFSLSFGPGTVTSTYQSAVDSFMLSNPNGLVMVSACNYGPNEMTVTGLGNGKNAVSVGAAENNRGDWFQSDDNPWGLWTGSAKGPVSASDVRVKPDVVEIGAGVVIAQSTTVNAYDGSLYRGCNNNGALMVPRPGTTSPAYCKNQGTSFSAPAAAGDATLIRQYLVDVHGYDNTPSEGTNEPDAMLIKAFLIHGARDMGFGYPSYGQGWGLASPEYSIAPPAPLSNKHWSGTGDSGPITIDVKTSLAPLKVTMAHWDTGTSSGALTVNYDLVVTAPDGTTKYYGNAFAESESIPLSNPSDWSQCRFPTWSAFPGVYPDGYYDWDTNNDGGDDINNVEVVLINAPMKGEWKIDIVHRAGSSAGWSAVASADFGPQSAYHIAVEQDTPVTYHMRDGYGTQSHQARAGGTISVGFTVHNFGLNTDTVILASSYQGDGSAPGSTLPSGWSVSFDTGAILNMNPDERIHVMAQVTASSGASEGAYPIRIMATSSESTSRGYFVFNVDIVNQRLPNRIQVTDSKLPNMNPGISVYEDYVLISYLQDTGIGERVFVSVSSDGGDTFGDPIPVTTFADDPQCVSTEIAPAGHQFAGRAFIGYNAMKPLVHGDSWWHVTNRRLTLAYADPPYTSWTITHPLNNGEGPAAFNDYRETDIGFWINPGGPDEVWFIENNYYITQNDMNRAPSEITPYALRSTDGGATWPYGISISVGGSNQFSPSVSRTGAGDLVFSCYMIGNPRTMYYRYYDGTWRAAVQAMNLNPYDAMWGYIGGDPNADRAYVVAGRSSNANYNDFKIPHVTYTSNKGGSFSTPAGPLGTADNRCDNGHFDSNQMMDMDVTHDGVAWATARQHPTSTINRYWSYNLYSASSGNLYSTYTNNQLTADSYAKEPGFRATAQGNDLLVAYTAFETGPADIFMLRLFDGWQTAPDNMGPRAEVHAPDRWIQFKPLKISAIIDEFHSGFNNIQAAQYRWDGLGPVSMTGAFNDVAVSAEATDLMNLDVGWHLLEVRGQDSVGNWGPWAGKMVYVYSVVIPDEPLFAGLHRVINPGTGTHLRLEWYAASDPNGNEFPITYHIYRSTVPGFTPNNATNRIDMSQQSGMGDIGNLMTWDDYGVDEGQTYYYIVRAEDAGGDPPGDPPKMEMNTVERSGTPEELVYFQVQSPEAGFRNLNLDPFEATVQTGTTDVMETTGEYRIDPANGKWLSDALPYNSDLSGTWRFYVNGMMNNNRASGHLYAKVYRHSDDAHLFTTGYDNEDIAEHTGIYHQFVWDHIVATGTANLNSGDRYYVELWAHVTAVTGPPSGTQIVYDFSTGAGSDKWYYDTSWTTNPPSGYTAQIFETASSNYPALAAMDGTLHQGIDAGTPNYAAVKTVMTLAENPADIAEISMLIHAQTDSTQDAGTVKRIYAWNHGTGEWVYIAEGMFPGRRVLGTISGTLDPSVSGFTTWDDFFDASNRFTWLAFSTTQDGNNFQTRFDTDYIKTTVVQTATPDGVFTFGYDSDATPSAVHPELPVGSGPSPEAYHINLTGHPGGWAFVSFPIAISGNIETILDDSVHGGGGTNWDVAKWYDGSTQRWKTYRKGYTDVSTFSTITNQMGVWLHITSSDGNLTTGVTGNYPTTTVNIQLYTGWNMVGYPSATGSWAADTLPGDVTMVAIYQSTTPFIQDRTDLNAVWMTHGEAYWVYVTADCVWSVLP